MQSLNEKGRKEYVEGKLKEGSSEKTLDSAIIEIVHIQAKNANLSFDKK
jgi:hypothetical protein